MNHLIWFPIAALTFLFMVIFALQCMECYHWHRGETPGQHLPIQANPQD